jgi:hypothetical protein
MDVMRVQSQGVMVWMKRKASRFLLPALKDVLVRGESSECFEAFSKVVGHQESLERFLEILMGLIVIFLHSRFLERTVYAFHLTVRPPAPLTLAHHLGPS